MRPSLLALAPALALASCASPPQYLAAQRTGGAGYSEMRIEQNRYRVTYRAPNAAEARRMSSHREAFELLRRAQRCEPMSASPLERALLLDELAVEAAAVDENLVADDEGEPIDHPAIGTLFEGFDGQRYKLKPEHRH